MGKGFEDEDEEEMYEMDIDEAEREYNMKKNYYEEMLGEDGLKNLEDLKDLNIQTKEEEEQKNQELMQQEELRKQYQEDELQQQNQQEETPCPLCSGKKLKQKESNLPLNTAGQTNNGFVCCVHHSKEYFNTEDKDPRNYEFLPPCMLASVVPAGKPYKKEEPLYLFK